MADLVCYIPSYNDSEWVKESLASVPDWDVVISDNGSSELHRDALVALASPRVRVVRQEKSLGRVGNWRFCVDHFIDSGAAWMKFLFAGDRHKPDSCNTFRRAIERHPAIRFMVPRVENVWPHKRFLWGPTGKEAVLTSPHMMAVIVEHGNVFPGLVAPLFHVDTVKSGFTFGESTLSFCADLLFLMDIARRTPSLFITEVAAEFVAARRKSMLAGMYTLEHCLEEGLVRLRAADAYLVLGGDPAQRTPMAERIARFVREGLKHAPEKLSGEMQYSIEVLEDDRPLPTESSALHLSTLFGQS
jgi:glycosyltransferase involved in cell wall biosynthesis